MKSSKLSLKQASFKTRGALALSVLLVAASLTGCGTAAKTAVKAPPVPVQTDTIALTALPTSESYLGQVTPYIQTVLAPSLSGILNSVSVRTGDIVTKGQVLATIDTSVLQAQEGQADASLSVAQAQLGATGESANNSLAQAEAALKTAQINVANAQTAANSSITNAQKALTTAETQLANAQVQYNNSLVQGDNGVKQAQAAVDTAKANLDAAKVQAQNAQASLEGAQNVLNTANTALQHAQQAAHSSTDQALLTAQTAYDNASNALQAAQSSVANDNATVTKDQAALDAAQVALNAAQASSQSAQDSKSVQTAQAQVDQAKAALEASTSAGDSSVAAAKAQENQAQTTYQTLLNNPQLQVNQAQIQSAQSGVQVIQAQINNGQVVAPVGGYVTAVNAQVGQAVGPQGGFITIASMSPLQATVSVPEDSIGKMKTGLGMSVYVPATEETLAGTVSAVHPAPDPTSKQYSVDITLTPGKQQLLPGMQVEAHLLNSNQKGIVVPADSIVTMQSGSYAVYVVQNGKAKEVMVHVGAMTGSVYQITSGLNVGDQVVVKGQNLISDGDSVKIVQGQTSTSQGSQGSKAKGSSAGAQTNTSKGS
jgi:RND family efflux transporter MFP subunit